MTGSTPGPSRIEWVRGGCRLLGSIAAEFARTRPFEGLTIGTGIHLEPKTVALLLTLAQGGARVVSTGNLSSTQADAAGYLRARGVEVIGAATTDQGVHDGYLRQVIATRPHLLLDNGGDLFVRYLAGPYPGLLGGTEETTSGRMRLRPLAARLGVPVLVINDSPIKQFAENRHAVGQSVLESYLRITNRMTNGRQVAVFGYGPCGKGVAANFRNACASVAVVEVNPVTRLEASLDGFAVPGREEALVPVPRFIDEQVATSFLDLHGRSGTTAPRNAAPGGSGSRPAPAAAGRGAGGVADDEGTGQHDAAGHPPGPDVPA